MATNLTEMNGIPAGALCRCSARATNSLPVPDSPVTTAVRSQLAAVSIWRASSCIAGESPIMPTLLSFDSEFTSLFPPGEICDLLAQFDDSQSLDARSASATHDWKLQTDESDRKNPSVQNR